MIGGSIHSCSCGCTDRLKGSHISCCVLQLSLSQHHLVKRWEYSDGNSTCGGLSVSLVCKEGERTKNNQSEYWILLNYPNQSIHTIHSFIFSCLVPQQVRRGCEAYHSWHWVKSPVHCRAGIVRHTHIQTYGRTEWPINPRCTSLDCGRKPVTRGDFCTVLVHVMHYYSIYSIQISCPLINSGFSQVRCHAHLN